MAVIIGNSLPNSLSSSILILMTTKY